MPSLSLAARATLAASLLAVVGVVAGPAIGARTHTTGTAVTVTATEFHFKLSKTSVPHGSVTFTVVNKGHVGHDFKIGGKKTALHRARQERQGHRDPEEGQGCLPLHRSRSRRGRHEGHAHRQVGRSAPLTGDAAGPGRGHASRARSLRTKDGSMAVAALLRIQLRNFPSAKLAVRLSR